MGQTTIAAADGGSFEAYVAAPPGSAGPGLLVIQEIFGVNATMRDIADTYAREGYFAAVPDLFWRLEPGVQLSDQGPDFARAMTLFGRFDEQKGMADLIATLAVMRTMESCTGKVGAIGFCLGGRLAFLMATRSDAECSVSYYGVGLEKNAFEMVNVRRPLLLHIAEKDEFSNPIARSQVLDTAKHFPLVTANLYPGVGHGFARMGGATFKEGAAMIAQTRTLDFLKRHLG
jgi:carboxymethylenebutenolidase